MGIKLEVELMMPMPGSFRIKHKAKRLENAHDHFHVSVADLDEAAVEKVCPPCLKKINASSHSNDSDASYGEKTMKPVAYRFKSPATEDWLLGLEPPVGSRWEIEGLYRMQVNVPRTPLEKAAKEMLRCVDRMLRDGDWLAEHTELLTREGMRDMLANPLRLDVRLFNAFAAEKAAWECARKSDDFFDVADWEAA